MSKHDKNEVEEFLSALQLSINTKINGLRFDEDQITLYFDVKPKKEDRNLFRFLKLFQGSWKNKDLTYIGNDVRQFDIPKVTLFLLLTRMNENKIKKLIEIDTSMRVIAGKLGFSGQSRAVTTLPCITEEVFRAIDEKGITIRELAEKTGLTQVTISNFKAGGDIRISNLIKIIRALSLELFLK